jgi:two-component system, NarL family, sensor histidine kinase DesK
VTAVESTPTNPVLFPHPASVGDMRWKWRSGWRRIVFPGVFLVYLGQTVQGIAKHTSGATALVGYVLLVGFGACYLTAMPYMWAGRRRAFWTLYAVLVALVVVEALFAHESAFVMVTFLVVLTIAGLNERAAAIVAGYIVATAVVPALIPSWHSGVDYDGAFSILIVAMAMYGFFAIVRSNQALSVARAEVAQLAAEMERNRIARDLHDLLGHSLTTITVKAALARRLSATDPVRAAREIAEVEELSRRSLADVRAAVSNYRDVTLAGELAAGREMLRAAGVDPQFPNACDVVRPEHAELFGWVVREGVTNVVRHARATRCSITLHVDALEVVDDGSAAGTFGAGNGLAGLRERVEAAGGTFAAGGIAPVGFRLRVDMPLRADGSSPAGRAAASA